MTILESADLFTAPQNASPVCDVTLPEVIPAVQGVECNIYWDGLLLTQSPIEAFDVDVNCEIGRHDQHRFRLTPTGGQVGDQSLGVSVRYDGNVVGSGSTTLRIKANTVGSGVTRKVIVIGDSLVDEDVITGQVLDQIAADSTTYAVTLLGTQGTGGNKHEGHSGRNINWFYSNASSPFVSGGSFNFAQYLTTNSYTMSTGDSVFILLGINDVFGIEDDEILESTLSQMVTQLNAMITNIHTTHSGVNVWIGLTVPPSRSQDSFGANYGCGHTRQRYFYNNGLWRKRVVEQFSGRSASRVRIAPIGLALDTQNNMQTTTEAINSHNATTVARQSNGVHPASSGYRQIGDSVYCCLMSLES